MTRPICTRCKIRCASPSHPWCGHCRRNSRHAAKKSDVGVRVGDAEFEPIGVMLDDKRSLLVLPGGCRLKAPPGLSDYYRFGPKNKRGLIPLLRKKGASNE